MVPLNILGTFKSFITSIAISSDGTKAAAGSRDTDVKIWNTKDGTLDRTLIINGYEVTSIAFSPDCSKIATSDMNKKIQIWNMADGSLIKTVSGDKYYVTSLVFYL